VPVNDLVESLRREGVLDVSASTLDRAMYAADASLNRVVPAAVARPRSVDELIAAVESARSWVSR
jgi:FAD/FMN-containing dehydrogenase